jgi:hypothetical protein
METVSTLSPGTFSALRRFVRPKKDRERCELCGAGIAADHQHLVEPAKNHRIACSCEACAILFDGQQNGRFRRVPRDGERLHDFHLSDVQWDGMHLPIGLAFFFFSTAADRVVALYPSPAGAIESLLTLEVWQELRRENPVLNTFQPDVEALLVNRVGNNRIYCRVPIDQCFKLVGLIRSHWHGLSGGTQVWVQINQFFEKLKGGSNG